MMDKVCRLEELQREFRSGQTIMVGGFGVPGTPFTLVDALLASGASSLTLIKNEANRVGMGVSKLIEAGRVARLITTHLGRNPIAIEMMNRGEIQVEFFPQGILAEKIRAGGAGLFGFLTDIGLDTTLRDNKRVITTLDGRSLIMESALRADIALIHGAVGDRSGNLIYEKSARNFNPLMATAAGLVIAEVEKVASTGELPPDGIHTPGAFVDRVVVLEKLADEYGILKDNVL
jgi:acetate CoA/acetoacetate CoA-transferase alpha subunit